MIGEDATHSIGLFSSSILKGHAIRIGLQNEFNIWSISIIICIKLFNEHGYQFLTVWVVSNKKR